MNSDFIVAVHALVFLKHRGKTLSSEALAKNICTNPARVRRVMGKLKKSGLIETREGRVAGGYTYQAEKEITLRQISQALKIKFVETAWHSGNEDMNCQIASGMAGYMDELYDTLDRRCQAYLDTVTVDDVERKLFASNESLEVKIRE